MGKEAIARGSVYVDDYESLNTASVEARMEFMRDTLTNKVASSTQPAGAQSLETLHGASGLTVERILVHGFDEAMAGSIREVLKRDTTSTDGPGTPLEFWREGRWSIGVKLPKVRLDQVWSLTFEHHSPKLRENAKKAAEREKEMLEYML